MPIKRSNKRLIIILLVIIIALAAWGIFSRIIGERRLNEQTQDESTLTVKTTKPVKSGASEAVVFPGTVEAWHEASIYARTNGYLKKWYTGLGSVVKEGDLLAEIETPEVDAELHQAEADLATAKANNVLAQSTTKRWEDLLKTNSVSKQEADEKRSDAASKAASVAAAQANVDRLRNLQSFKRVTAPFDGMITSRTTDNGALITSGSTTGQILFHLVQADKLRIYLQIPQNYAAAITSDTIAELHFPEQPTKVYKEKLYHMGDALDPAARTLLIEFIVDNKNGELFPGGYVEAHLNLGTFSQNLRVPTNTLVFRGDDVQVAVVEEGHALLKTVVLGRDFGNDVEIVSGLNENDQVILNPPDSLISGQKAKIAEPEPDKASDKKTAKEPARK